MQHPLVNYLSIVRFVTGHGERDHEHLLVLAHEEPEGPHPHDALPRVVLEHEHMVIPKGLDNITGLHPTMALTMSAVPVAVSIGMTTYMAATRVSSLRTLASRFTTSSLTVNFTVPFAGSVTSLTRTPRSRVYTSGHTPCPCRSSGGGSAC